MWELDLAYRDELACTILGECSGLFVRVCEGLSVHRVSCCLQADRKVTRLKWSERHTPIAISGIYALVQVIRVERFLIFQYTSDQLQLNRTRYNSRATVHQSMAREEPREDVASFRCPAHRTLCRTKLCCEKTSS